MAKKKKKSMQNEVAESAHKVWLAGLGALALAEEEGSKVFKNLVDKGETFETRSKKNLKKVQGRIEGQVETARDKAEKTWNKIGSSFDDKVAGALERLGVPSRSEIQKLTRKVERLTKKIDELKPAPKRTTAATRRARTA